MIHPSVRPHLDDIRSILKKHAVKEAYVYGSAVTENFSDQSDLDLLVEFQDGIETTSFADLWWDLCERIEETVHHPVDVVTLSSITNPYFLQEVEATREAIL
jgi:hypothetical protein